MSQKLLTIDEFCQMYRVSRSTAYRLAKRCEINIVKIGSASRIPQDDADRWYKGLQPIA